MPFQRSQEEARIEEKVIFTYPIVLLIIFILLLGGTVIINFMTSDDLRVKYSRVIAISQVIGNNIIPVITITRNEAVYKFFKRQRIMKFLKICKSNRIEPLVQLELEDSH